ncbi:MAG: ribonuclease H-like domain-containing protein [Anaerolineae bacterium]|nr:ribonuclease H-like domain-containing protein [Anaerolineae bacterium]
MPSLSDKLKALGVQVGARNLPSSPKHLPEAHPIEEVVAGHLRSTPHGPAFLSETAYTASYRHGQAGLCLEAPLGCIADWADTRLAGCDLEQFAFLDTETSGLAGGTGTYAFLIGAGRFDGDTFHLTQFFMRDPTEERAQLHALAEFLEPCRALVTFNGKSFDAPLLNTRYTLHGQESPLPELAHLDLLTLARRLWRDRLPDRSLGNLEIEILGFERAGEDVPGWLIPQIYFDYLRGGDARPIAGIFYHNAMDIVAMAALLNHMAQLLADPLTAVEHALDLVAVGKLFEALGQIEQAVTLFNHGMDRNDLPEEHYWLTQQRLSFIHKRADNMVAAVEVWELAAEGRQIYAHVELAKFYEHKQRDYRQALDWTEIALDLLNQPTASRHERQEWLGDLKHRRARLQKKLARGT